jgi:acetoin:2,6-dichlorophenolindophenol oxidoreductase subunit alpha
LIQEGHATDEDLKRMESAIEKEIDAAVEFAISSPEPDVDELHRDVFAAEQLS